MNKEYHNIHKMWIELQILNNQLKNLKANKKFIKSINRENLNIQMEHNF